MTDDEKNKAALAAKDQEIADLKARLASAGSGTDVDGDVRARAVAEAEDRDAIVPSPTQAELDATKLGEHHEGKSGTYKTRQTKAA